MTRVEKIAICLVCGLAVNAGRCAQGSATEASNPLLMAHRQAMIARSERIAALLNKSGASHLDTSNPYTSIVARNVFGLNPSQPVIQTQTVPLDKITPNGIMTIFGSKQVLFKVTTPAALGRPATDTSYILSEGQSQDDIKVVHVDEPNGVVTFDNHGTVQEIPLAKASPIVSPTPAPTPVAFRNFNRAPNVNGVNSGAIQALQAREGFNRDRNLNNGFQNNGGFQSQSSVNNEQTRNSMSGLSADDQAVIVAARHAEAIEQGSPSAVLFPPTKYDTAAGIPPVPGK